MNWKALVILSVMVFTGCVVLSTIWRPEPISISKVSPDGTYRVLIEFREEPGTGTRSRNERLKITCFKGQQIVEKGEWVNSDQYERSLRDGFERVEWIANNVLAVGRVSPHQPFRDEFMVSNNTDETIQYLNVDYGSYESVHVFDLAGKSKITLLASPGFLPDGSSNHFLGYSCKTASGKSCPGRVIEKEQRKSPADGPLKFNIVINPADLRQ